MRVAFHTLGCKVNQYETEALREKFISKGYEPVDEKEIADIYIINTCTVTNLADRKSRQFIRKARKKNPNSIIAVTGCYAQVSPSEVKNIDGVDIIVGTDNKGSIVELVEKSLASGNQEINITQYENLNKYENLGVIGTMESRCRAFVKIQEGCNRFCSYCIIPYARGKVRSRNQDEIIKEVKGLLKSGYKEIVLTGINTALYGEETGELKIDCLIEEISKIDGDFRIRLSSLEPTVINKDYVKKLLSKEKLCHHLHLSIQSGSDDVLGLMNRRYSREDFLEIVKVLQNFDLEYGITTDIIVGFPGETDEDFKDSINIIGEAGFSDVHVFKYSKRKNTKAAEMENQVPGVEKNRRSRILIEESKKIRKNFIDRNLGKIKRVLFERIENFNIDEKEVQMSTGYTDNYIKVYVHNKRLENEFAQVKLVRSFKDGIIGEIIKN